MPIRTLTFEQISDSRFGGCEDSLLEIVTKVNDTLGKVSGVSVKQDQIRKLNFSASGNEESSKSWRVRFYVQKKSRKTSWTDIYKLVNNIKPVSYDYIYKHSFIEA